MNLSTLEEWVAFIAAIHGQEMELGLARVKSVAERLNLLSMPCPVIIVGGTNGKGSTVAGIEAIYLEAGYQVGAFTSPYLFTLNEEIRLNGQSVSDDLFCQAFQEIETHREQTSLTMFEYITLAALLIFKTHALDIIILEVGLGGRLDAVNILDADVAVITSIGIDHVDWLGSTREQIAIEKAGIFRAGRPVVCGDSEPPDTLVAAAQQLNAPFFCQGKDFHYDESLPYSLLAKQNMAVAIKTVDLLNHRLPVTPDQIKKAMANVSLPGRLQIIPGAVTEVWDVSHNPEAVSFLVEKLKTMPVRGKTFAVFSMLGDKDITTCLALAKDSINHWYIAPLAVKRGASSMQLISAFEEVKIKNLTLYPSIAIAYQQAVRATRPGDRIIIFGSFYTIAQANLAKQP